MTTITTASAPGWMPTVEHIPTAAYGYRAVAPGSMRALAVMSHIMQGYQQTMIEWAKQRRPAPITKRSAHFTINRQGRIIQHASIFDPTWAARYVSNPTWRLLPPNTNPNHVLVHIEHEGFAVVPKNYGYDYVYNTTNPWPNAMVSASIKVNKWVLETLNIEASRDTIIGHFMTDYLRRANDPGTAWPRTKIIDACSGVINVPARLGPIEAAKAAYLAQRRGRLYPVRFERNLEVHEMHIPRRKKTTDGD